MMTLLSGISIVAWSAFTLACLGIVLIWIAIVGSLFVGVKKMNKVATVGVVIMVAGFLLCGILTMTGLHPR